MNLQRQKLTAFGKHIGAIEDGILASDSCLNDVKKQLSFMATDYSKPRRRPYRIVLGVAAALVTAILLVFFLRDESITAEYNGQALTGGNWISSNDAARATIHFSDGAMVSLEGRSRIRINQMHKNGAHLLLEAGKIKLNVPHRAQTAWRIDVGPYIIQVIGTRFSVAWDGDVESMELRMTEGVVSVSGPMITGHKEVRSGERLAISTQTGRLEFLTNNSPTTSMSEEPAILAEPSAVEKDNSASIEQPTENNSDERSSHRQMQHPPPLKKWKSAAEAGRYAESVRLATAAGISRILASADGADLLLLGDAARHSGNISLAQKAYRTTYQRFSGSGFSSNAAFALGVIAFDRTADYGTAIKWFSEIVKSKRNKSHLHREACGRLMESYNRLGNNSLARKTAQQYISLYPNGPHHLLAEQILTP